jgi:hypothetical protein
MTNHNQNKYEHKKIGTAITIGAIGALGAIGVAELVSNNSANTISNHPKLTPEQIQKMYPKGGGTIDEVNPNIRLMVGSKVNSKTGDAVFLSNDGGKSWEEIARPSVNALKGQSELIDASFAPSGIQGSTASPQYFETTWASNNGETFTVNMYKVSNGEVESVDVHSADILLNSNAGTWSKATNGDTVYIFGSPTGGGNNTDSIIVNS